MKKENDNGLILGVPIVVYVLVVSIVILTFDKSDLIFTRQLTHEESIRLFNSLRKLVFNFASASIGLGILYFTIGFWFSVTTIRNEDKWNKLKLLGVLEIFIGILGMLVEFALK